MYLSLDDVIAQTERWLLHYGQCCRRWSQLLDIQHGATLAAFGLLPPPGRDRRGGA